MTDDDWAPLPEADLWQRPGEAADLGKREIAPAPLPSSPPGPSSPSSSSSPPPTKAKPAADDPAAERALAALKAKLAQSAPAVSLIAEAQHREQREQRKQKAAGAPQLAATMVKGEDPFAKPVVEYDVGPDGRDEREESEWFRALPGKEQNRLRREWTTERGRFRDVGVRLRRRFTRATTGGAMVFGGLGICQSLLLGGFGLVPIMIGAGVLAAAIAELARGDRFVYALCGGLAWTAVMGPALLANPFAMSGLSIAAYGLACVGMDGEMRRSGGFPDR